MVCGRQLPGRATGAISAHARLFNFPAKPFVGTYVDWKTHCLKTAFLSNSYAACRVSALLELGLFPEDVIFGEDMYVAVRVLQVGYNMVYAADACVYHSILETAVGRVGVCGFRGAGQGITTLTKSPGAI